MIKLASETSPLADWWNRTHHLIDTKLRITIAPELAAKMIADGQLKAGPVKIKKPNVLKRRRR